MCVLFDCHSVIILLFINFSLCFVFFFKQKTAYEVRISDWSSDVCSSDLREPCSEAFATTCRSFAMHCVNCRGPSSTCRSRLQRATCDSICTQIGRASCRERVCQYV